MTVTCHDIVPLLFEETEKATFFASVEQESNAVFSQKPVNEPQYNSPRSYSNHDNLSD